MLANIPVSQEESDNLAGAFSETLAVVDKLRQVDTTGVEPTHQVTELENVWREDNVDTERMFSQDQALHNAARTHQGYFVVPQILEES